MTTTTAPDTGGETPLAPWWLVLLEGGALLVLGLLLVIQPGQTSVVVIRLLGLYWFLAGILKIVAIFLDGTRWFWKLLIGILGIVAGFIVIEYPLWSTFAVGNSVVILLGFFGIAIGLFGLYEAFTGAGWGTGLLSAISIVLGVVLLVNRWLLTLSLPWVLGILAIAGGLATIISAFRLRAAGAEPQPVARAAQPRPPLAEQQAAGQAEARLGDEIMPPEVPKPEEEPSPGGPAAAVAAESVGAEPEEAMAGVAEEVVAQAPPFETTDLPRELTTVEGIGPAYAQALQEAGVDSLGDFLKRGATPKGRANLAEATGISPKLILKWVNHVDLFRIKGIGGEYAELLEAAGVDTVAELARRNPDNLHQKLVEVNDDKKLVRHVPGQPQVADWIEQAKDLPRVVSY